jgi:hypothetical protein
MFWVIQDLTNATNDYGPYGNTPRIDGKICYGPFTTQELATNKAKQIANVATPSTSYVITKAIAKITAVLTETALV